MRIFIDFDDTIVDTVDAFVPILQELMDEGLDEPKYFHREMITEWGIAELLDIPEELVHHAFSKVNYRNVHTMVDAPSAIWNMLNRGHEVHVVTSNPNEADIRAWLDRNHMGKVMLTSTPMKELFIASRKPDLVIEDNPDVARFCNSQKILCLLHSREWNVRLDTHGMEYVKRFSSWSSVLPLMDSMVPSGRSYDQWMWDRYGDVVVTSADWQCIGGGVIEDSNGNRWYDGEVEVNENGAKQSYLGARYDLLPTLAVEEVAKVLHRGAEKYGVDNWRGLSVEEIHNHTIHHAVNFNRSGKLEDLSHTACRALMALEIYLEQHLQEPEGQE